VIITRLGQHLTRVHKIQNAQEFKEFKAKCVRLPFKSKAGSPLPSKQPKMKKARPNPKQQQPHNKVEASSSGEKSYIQSGESTSEEHEKSSNTNCRWMLTWMI